MTAEEKLTIDAIKACIKDLSEEDQKICTDMIKRFTGLLNEYGPPALLAFALVGAEMQAR